MDEEEKLKITPAQINNIYSNHSADMLHNPTAAGDHDLRSNYGRYMSDLQRDKKTYYLKTLSASTSVIGWFYLILCPAVVFLLGWTGDASLLPYYLGIVVPVCLLFIISGRYIKFNGGKIVPKFLLLNAIVGIILAPAILTGIVGIQSLIGYIYYRQLRDQDIIPPMNSVGARPRIIAIIMLILIVCVGVYALTYKNPLNPMFGKIDFISDLSNNRIYSENYKFSIRMPFRTTISNDTENDNPYAIFESGADNTGYIVIAHDYSNLGYELKEVLMLNFIVGSTIVNSDGTLIKKEPSLFNQFNAIDSEFTTIDSKTNTKRTSYYKAVINGRYLYEIYTINLSKASFEKFVNTFQFEK